MNLARILGRRSRFSVFVAVSTSVSVFGLGAVGACTDAGEADSGGSGGGTTAAQGPTTVASSTTGTTTSTTASSSGTGGAAGCLPAATSAEYFTIQGTDLCVVAVYDAAGIDTQPYGVAPTWGRHGGPLTSAVEQTGTTATLHLERWSISGTTLTKAETTSTLSNVTAGAFFTAQLLDLPSLSAIGWSGASFSTDGQLVITSDTMQQKTYLATGVFGLGAIGPNASQVTRILYTGLSGASGPTSNVNGLYAADVDASGNLVGTSAAIAAWGEASGPVAIDKAGNAFAINTKFTDSTQEVRGFEASVIDASSAPTAGNVVLDTTGYGSALAAVAPSGALPGIVAFQPVEGAGTPADVIGVPYTAAAGTITAQPSAKLLQLTTAGTTVSLMSDDQARLWVGIENVTAGMGSKFFVLSRP